MLDGGAETTRTVIAHTIVNLFNHPDELEKLHDGADLGVAIEEFIRYVKPIHNMCGVARADADVAGSPFPRVIRLCSCKAPLTVMRPISRIPSVLT